MKLELNTDERLPIWKALSEFYLDTELQESDFRHIALTILKSPYNLKEVKKINKYEVFPALQFNLLDVAGVWDGFNEEWLQEEIVRTLKYGHLVKGRDIESEYDKHKWMCIDYWEKSEQVYNEIKKEG